MSSLELLRDAVVVLFVCFDFLVCFEGFSFSSYIYCYSPRISTPGVRLYLRIAVDWGGKRQLRICLVPAFSTTQNTLIGEASKCLEENYNFVIVNNKAMSIVVHISF